MSSTIQNPSLSLTKGSLAGTYQMIISGSGFSKIQGSFAVLFGTTGALKPTVVSDTQLSMIVPPTNTAGEVSVTLNCNLGQGILLGTFSYMLPEVTGLNPGSSAPVGGKKITVTGNYFTGATGVNFGGPKGAGGTKIQVLSDTKLTITNPNVGKEEKVHVCVDVQGQFSQETSKDLFTYTNADNQPVPIVFNCDTPADWWIQFIGSDKPDATLIGSYYDAAGTKHTMSENTAYQLSTMISGTPIPKTSLPSGMPAILVQQCSGRFYISYKHKLENLGPGYTPDASNPKDLPNYNYQYQYIEPTISGSQLNVDLSYIDFTTFSVSIQAKNAPHGSNILQTSQPTQQLVSATAGSSKTPNGNVLPTPADKYPLASFARVISPQLGADGVYHDFTNYLQTFMEGKSVRIAGTYVGTGDQPAMKKVNGKKVPNPLQQAQSYDYDAKFSGGTITFTPRADSGNGYAKGVPKVQQGDGVGTAGGNIVITFEDLNAKTGVYGCNTPYQLGSNPKTKGITTDIYGQVVGDLLSGLNYGYVGSETDFKGGKIKDLSSTEWWGGIMPDGTAIDASATPGGNKMYYGDVQSDSDYYNTYAGSICHLTAGYGFPFGDRLGKNLMSLNTNTDADAYMEVWVDKQVVE